jgi:GH24 family phage-related lysozyme (muramidase)
MNRFLIPEENSWDSVASAFSNSYLAAAAQSNRKGKSYGQIGGASDASDAQTSLSDGRSSDGRRTSSRRTTDARPTKMDSQDLVSLVKNFEGFSPKPYGDHGQTSIGYGTRSKDGDTNIDENTATIRLNDELAMHRDRVIAHASKAGYQFSPNQIDALTSFDYNTGSLEQLTGGGARTTEQIADAMLLYNKASGKTLPGLENRRKTERDIFLNGY